MDKLDEWFSQPRMLRYASATNPGSLYVWDSRLSKAFLEDIGHIEVLLRNFIASRLRADCIRRTDQRCLNWYDCQSLYNLDERFAAAVDKSKTRLRHEGRLPDYDHVIGALTFDVWRYLLVKRLEPTVWKAMRDRRNGGMPHYPGASRADFEQRVSAVYALRNRCSHQEHLVMDDLDEESRRLDKHLENIDWIAKRIDPDAAEWISSNSSVPAVRNERPVG